METVPKPKTKDQTYYEKNKRYANVMRSLSEINRVGRTPRYTFLTAYKLYKDEAGKWQVPDDVQAALKLESRQQTETHATG